MSKQDSPKVEETKETAQVDTSKPEIIEFDVTLANGREITLEAIADQQDIPLDAIVAAQRQKTAAFLDRALTRRSAEIMYMSGATLRDFPTIAAAYGKAIGALKDA